MSGGVDSSVAAALLKEQGHDVVGVTMRLLPDEGSPPTTPNPNSPAPVCARPRPSAASSSSSQRPGGESGRGCCGVQAIDDAARVCHRLGIPHYVYDLRKQFERHVIADFCLEYARGRTPNPCIRCNRFLKFDILLKRARALDADWLATGHYAGIERSGRRWLLKRAADPAKDQTYFLYAMTQAQLRHTLFPVGHLTKPEVRDAARRLGLLVADKKESQEVCFAPGGSAGDFVAGRFPDLNRPGPILDTSGRRIGTHQGLAHYTIGQRRRIGIAAPEPLYVLAIGARHNTITVGTAAAARCRSFVAADVNWVGISRPESELKAEVQIRYQHKPVPGRLLADHERNPPIAPITPTGAPVCVRPRPSATNPPDSLRPLRLGGESGRGDALLVILDEPQWAVTPGQAAVFYRGDVVLGGGTIERVMAD
jgi:tRNA-specific 2-thiouridylase